jgi:hypothetical protein
MIPSQGKYLHTIHVFTHTPLLEKRPVKSRRLSIERQDDIYPHGKSTTQYL